MEISPLRLAFLLFCSFLLGIGVGIFYDVNRIIRVFWGCRYSVDHFDKLYSLRIPFTERTIPKKSNHRFRETVQKTIVFIGDIGSVLTATIGVLVLNYSYNSGRFRFFTVIGLLVGFLLYYFTLGRLVMLISEPLVVLAKYVFLSALVIFGYPFKFFWGFAGKKLNKLVFLYSFTLENREKKMYNIEEKEFLLRLAKNGFLNSGVTDIK